MTQTNGYVQYFSPIPLYVTGAVTIQAYATAFNYGQSPVITATYTVVSSDPVPVLKSMSPVFAGAGNQAFMLAVSGSGFMSTSTVSFGTTPLLTQFVSSNQLTAQVTTVAIANAGVITVTIQNPAPGGGTSNALQFELDSGSAMPPVFAVTSATVMAGSNASYPVTLPSSANGVSVRCLNMPSGASCSYSANSGALTITTSSSTPSGTYPITAVFTETLPGAPALASAVLLLFPFASSGLHRKKLRASMLTIIVVTFLLVTIGCGGVGGGEMQPQNHQVTSSGVVTLTVQ